MKFIVIIIAISFWWFVLAFMLTSISNDPFISDLTITGNTSYIVGDISVLNASGDFSESASRTSFMSMTGRMFTFRIPESLLPDGFNVLLTFLNWFLLGLMVISIYRLANPLA